MSDWRRSSLVGLHKYGKEMQMRGLFGVANSQRSDEPINPPPNPPPNPPESSTEGWQVLTDYDKEMERFRSQHYVRMAQLRAAEIRAEQAIKQALITALPMMTAAYYAALKVCGMSEIEAERLAARYQHDLLGKVGTMDLLGAAGLAVQFEEDNNGHSTDDGDGDTTAD